jgi:hypothetical protein
LRFTRRCNGRQYARRHDGAALYVATIEKIRVAIMCCQAKAFSNTHEFQSSQAVAGDPPADRFRRPNMMTG